MASWTSEHPEAEKRWDADRDETEAERLDRNWSSLLQELRVTQTGVQLLTGFLLTLPFQQRFTVLDGTMRTIYLITVACSIGSTVLLVRAGRHAPACCSAGTDWMPSCLDLSMLAPSRGWFCSGLALAGVAVVIFDTVIGRDRRLDRGRLHAGGIRRLLVPRAAAAAPQSRQVLLGFVKR